MSVVGDKEQIKDNCVISDVDDSNIVLTTMVEKAMFRSGPQASGIIGSSVSCTGIAGGRNHIVDS